MRETFTIAAADYDNIGDALIRRRALEWMSECDRLHVYLGSGGPDWSEALAVPTHATTYHRAEMQSFVRALLHTRRPVLVFDPGEAPLTAASRQIELRFLVLTLIARLRRGDVVRLPRGVRGTDRVSVTAFRLAVRLSQVVTWRNRESLAYMGHGCFVPDLAIGEANGLPPVTRNKLVISLRGDRPYPSDTWFEGVASFANQHDLQVLAVAQVRNDSERATSVAARLGAEYVVFEDRNIIEQEALLRGIYNETLAVVSDRLHVLVLATDQGAAPLELVPAPAPKITQHFGAIGIRDVSVDAIGLTSKECAAALEHAVNTVEEVQHAFVQAAECTGRLERQVRALLRGR